MSDNIEPEYVERAAALKADAAAAEIEKIVTVHGRLKDAAKTVAESAVECANLARELGLHLQVLCGHEQITFSFWQSYCAGKLPFPFEAAKAYIAVARKAPRRAKTLVEAFDHLQPILVSQELLELPARGEQHHAPIPLFERFLGAATAIRQPFLKILRQCPMSEWRPAEVKKFLSETEWLEQERAKAKALLK